MLESSSVKALAFCTSRLPGKNHINAIFWRTWTVPIKGNVFRTGRSEIGTPDYLSLCVRHHAKPAVHALSFNLMSGWARENRESWRGELEISLSAVRADCPSRCGRQQPWTPAHLNTLSRSVPTTRRQQDSRGLPNTQGCLCTLLTLETSGTVTRIQPVLNSRLPKVARENLHKRTAFNASMPTATHAGTSAIQG